MVKLVRDLIPSIIQETGRQADYYKASDQEYKKCLKEKLLEEVNEYIESEEIEELADIMEVMFAILDFEGVSLDKLEKLRLDKKKERGGFERRLILKEFQ